MLLRVASTLPPAPPRTGVSTVLRPNMAEVEAAGASTETLAISQELQFSQVLFELAFYKDNRGTAVFKSAQFPDRMGLPEAQIKRVNALPDPLPSEYAPNILQKLNGKFRFNTCTLLSGKVVSFRLLSTVRSTKQKAILDTLYLAEPLIESELADFQRTTRIEFGDANRLKASSDDNAVWHIGAANSDKNIRWHVVYRAPCPRPPNISRS